MKKKYFKFLTAFTIQYSVFNTFLCYYYVADEALVVVASANPELYNVSLRNYQRLQILSTDGLHAVSLLF